MGFRFYRRFRPFPGLRLNLSRSGLSTSVGRRGAWFTLGPRGTRETIGVPGTGISYTAQQSFPKARPEPVSGVSIGLIVVVVAIAILALITALVVIVPAL